MAEYAWDDADRSAEAGGYGSSHSYGTKTDPKRDKRSVVGGVGLEFYNCEVLSFGGGQQLLGNRCYSAPSPASGNCVIRDSSGGVCSSDVNEAAIPLRLTPSKVECDLYADVDGVQAIRVTRRIPRES